MSQQEALQLYAEAQAAYDASAFERAADMFTELLLHPDLPADRMGDVQWNLGLCFLGLGKVELAREHFQTSGHSADEYEAAIAEHQRAAAHQLFDEGSGMYAAGDYSRAADVFAELLLHPGFPADRMHEAHWNLGLCFLRTNDEDRAREHFEASGAAASDYADLFQANRTDQAQQLFVRAEEQYGSGDYRGAADTFAELILHPGLPADRMHEVQWNMGLCFLQLGNEGLGRQHLQSSGASDGDIDGAVMEVQAAREARGETEPSST